MQRRVRPLTVITCKPYSHAFLQQPRSTCLPLSYLFKVYNMCTTHVFMHTLKGENIKKYARRPRMTTRGILERNLSQGLSCSFINPYFTPQYPQQENSSLGPCPSDDDHLVPCSFKQHVGTAYMPSNLESSKPDINTINAVN